MKIGTTTDPTMTTMSESAPVGFSRTAAGAKRGRTAGDVSSARQPRNFSLEAHFVSAGKRERRGRSVPSSEARGRKGFVPVLRVGLRISLSITSGEIRPGFGASAFFSAIGVWQTFGRRGGKGNGSGGGAQVKESGGPAGSSEPVRVVRFTLIFLPFSDDVVSLNPQPRSHPQETGEFPVQFPTARKRRTLPKGGAERSGMCVLPKSDHVERLTF